MSDTEKFLDRLSSMGERMAAVRKDYEAENDAWWSGLSEQEREDAFYAVVKRIYKGEIIDQGSYRYVLYDIFGFDASMYIRGMDCGYMNIHNAIVVAEEGEDV
jgi:hypothetical protein